MSRLPPIPRSQQDPKQKQAQDEIERVGSVFGQPLMTKDHDGTMVGPFSPMLYTPQLAGPFASLASIIPKLPHITPRIRELAILAVGSYYEAPYVLYAHSRIAQAAGLSSEQVADAERGILPAELDDAEKAAWEFSRCLAGARGPLDAAIWENARTYLGTEGVANLAHVVGSYAYLCIYQNAVDTRAPNAGKI